MIDSQTEELALQVLELAKKYRRDDTSIIDDIMLSAFDECAVPSVCLWILNCLHRFKISSEKMSKLLNPELKRLKDADKVIVEVMRHRSGDDAKPHRQAGARLRATSTFLRDHPEHYPDVKEQHLEHYCPGDDNCESVFAVPFPAQSVLDVVIKGDQGLDDPGMYCVIVAFGCGCMLY